MVCLCCSKGSHQGIATASCYFCCAKVTLLSLQLPRAGPPITTCTSSWFSSDLSQCQCVDHVVGAVMLQLCCRKDWSPVQSSSSDDTNSKSFSLSFGSKCVPSLSTTHCSREGTRASVWSNMLPQHHRKALYVIHTTVRNILTNVSNIFTKVCTFTPGQACLHLILLGMDRKDTLSLRRQAYRQKYYDSIVL